MKKTIKLARFTLLVAVAVLLLSAVLVACAPESKKCRATFVGMYDGYELYSQKIEFKESKNTVFEPVEVAGYSFQSFEGAPGYESVTLTHDLHKRVIKVNYQPEFLNLPVFWIDTFGGAEIKSKEDYITCGVSLTNTDEDFEFNNVLAGIRGRGNTTWGYDKKPYRIKFDKKQDLFGWDKNKSWVLLALYQDFSGIKDFTAFNLASAIGEDGSAFVPHARHVELYLNGEYQGLYLLTDQVQENKGRTDVEEDFDENSTEIPFLVEWDEYAPLEGKEGTDWFRIYNNDSGATSYYNVKYPDREQRFTQEQFDYVKNYIIKVNELCHTKNVDAGKFEEYVDLDAFIDYYLVQEIMGQVEINYKSVYMSKKSDGRLVMGPIWDFDYSAGGPMELGGNASPEVGLMSTFNWFYFMLKTDWFKAACLNRLEEHRQTWLDTLEDIKAYKTDLNAALQRNASLWDFEDDGLMSYGEHYDFVISYISKRIELLPSYINAVV